MQILASIITHNPELKRLEENLESIVPQVKKVLVVDNYSRNRGELQKLMKKFSNVSIVYLPKNMGIAYALNQVGEYAIKNEFPWFLTLDQDSVCKKSLVETYIPYTLEKNVAIITSFLEDRNDTLQKFDFSKEYSYVNKCFTSGSLMNTKIFKNSPGFTEKLFIDEVDYDYCFMMKSLGYKILQIHKIELLHELGDIEIVNFFGKEERLSNHSVFRKYYMARNRIYMARKYPNIDESWKHFYRVPKKFLIELIYGKEKWRTLCVFLKGYILGLFMKIEK